MIILYFFLYAFLTTVVYVILRILSVRKEERIEREKRMFVDSVLDGLRLDKMLSENPDAEPTHPKNWESFQ